MSVSVLNAPEEGQAASNHCEEVDLYIMMGEMFTNLNYTSKFTISVLIYKNTMKFVLRKHRGLLHTLFSFSFFILDEYMTL